MNEETSKAEFFLIHTHTLSLILTHTHLDGGGGHAEVEFILVLDAHLDQLLHAYFVLRQKGIDFFVEKHPRLCHGLFTVTVGPKLATQGI